MTLSIIIYITTFSMCWTLAQGQGFPIPGLETCENFTALVECGRNECANPSNCYSFSAPPPNSMSTCIRDCVARGCGIDPPDFRTACGSELNATLFMACGIGCFKSPAVQSDSFSLSQGAVPVLVCIANCFSTACRVAPECRSP